MTSRLTAETWENHLEKDTKEKGAAALHSLCFFHLERLQRSAQVLKIFTTNKLAHTAVHSHISTRPVAYLAQVPHIKKQHFLFYVFTNY